MIAGNRPRARHGGTQPLPRHFKNCHHVAMTRMILAKDRIGPPSSSVLRLESKSCLYSPTRIKTRSAAQALTRRTRLPPWPSSYHA